MPRGAQDHPQAGVQMGRTEMVTAPQPSLGGRAAAGGNDESRALTQDHHPLKQGRMQEAASASPAFLKREAKALPNIQGLEGAIPC